LTYKVNRLKYYQIIAQAAHSFKQKVIEFKELVQRSDRVKIQAANTYVQLYAQDYELFRAWIRSLIYKEVQAQQPEALDTVSFVFK
jgi:cobalamin biosynthesis Co2+ chelatase CbiK